MYPCAKSDCVAMVNNAGERCQIHTKHMTLVDAVPQCDCGCLRCRDEKNTLSMDNATLEDRVDHLESIIENARCELDRL